MPTWFWRTGAVLLACWTVLQPNYAGGVQCEAETYGDTGFTQPVVDFSPYDRIYVIATCRGIEAGEHAMHANWVHQRRGMIRSDAHHFVMEKAGERSVYFWFKLAKKGPLASTFSGSDFNEKQFGDWQVDIYFDETLVSSQAFTIQEGADY